MTFGDGALCFLTEREVPLAIQQSEQLEGLERHPPPSREQCVGMDVPEFLGGNLELSNLSLFTRDVYWHICAELIRRVSRLPPGTRVSSIRIE